MKPFSEDWWWKRLLEHVYNCKWKYFNEDEMKKDIEITNYIIHRIKIRIEKNAQKNI